MFRIFELKYAKINESADLVTVSHNHEDHNNYSTIKGKPVVITTLDNRMVKDVLINSIQSYHDMTMGSQRGSNIIFTFKVDDVNVCHLGDLGYILTVEEIAKDITVPGTVISNDIKVSKVISARLVAPTFIITTDIPEQQALAGAEPTIWKWTLKPTIEGKQTIRLAIDAIVIVDGGKAERHIKTFEQTITVDINKPQLITRWLKEYGQWLWTSMLLPLIIWLWRKYRHVPEKI